MPVISGNLERPDVDKITGLSPVISIEQKRRIRIPVLQSALQQKFMIICVCFMHVLVLLILIFSGERMVKYTEEQILI